MRTCSSAAGAMLRVPAPSGRGPTRALEEDRRVTRGRLPPPRRSRARELPPRSAPPQPRRDSVDQIGASGAAIFAFAAVALGQRSIDESYYGGVVTADMLYVKILLIGCLMLFSLKYNPKGLLPEVPVRPSRPEEVTGGE